MTRLRGNEHFEGELVVRETIYVPDLTHEDKPVESAEVIEIYAKPGETLNNEDSILMIETNDSYLNIKARGKCRVIEIMTPEDQEVRPKQPIVIVDILEDSQFLDVNNDKWSPRYSRIEKDKISHMSNTSQECSVFLCFGRDEAAYSKLHACCHALRVNPVVLRREVSAGETYFNKFKSFDHIDAAICLLTADDIGRLSSDQEIDNEKRARQNVIWELGFFAGKLGASRVVLLTEDGVIVPSNLDGVHRITFDKFNGWRPRVATQLMRMGFQVDFSGLMDPT